MTNLNSHRSITSLRSDLLRKPQKVLTLSLGGSSFVPGSPAGTTACIILNPVKLEACDAYQLARKGHPFRSWQGGRIALRSLPALRLKFVCLTPCELTPPCPLSSKKMNVLAAAPGLKRPFKKRIDISMCIATLRPLPAEIPA
jgi:hypothetical protein